MRTKINLKNSLNEFAAKHVLIIGDFMLDKYTVGDVSRVSPEAPIPILNIVEKNSTLGGAGNVANNLAALGAKVTAFGIIGQDKNGKRLIEKLQLNKINHKFISTKSKPTTVKHRFISGIHQILRVDTENTNNLTMKEEGELLKLIKKEIPKCDGIILSDYGKGLFSKSLVQKIIANAKKNKKLITADIKPINQAFFKGVDLLTPNLKEAREMTSKQDVYETGKVLVNYYKTDILLKKGDKGITIFYKNGQSIELPIEQAQVYNVTGAGDTVISVATLGLLCKLDLFTSALLANLAAGIVVKKTGTATLTIKELEANLKTENHIDQINIIPKLWGYEKWLENNEKYCCKLLFIKKGFQSSLHYHKLKDEMFIVTKGLILMEMESELKNFGPGNFIRIPVKIKHRFKGLEDSLMIEVSTHHAEKDTYRIEESKKVNADE